MGLTKESKGLEAPIEKDVINEMGEEEVDEGEEPLEGAEAKKFRGIAARANYLGFGSAGHPVHHQGDL